jgi:hypothetical protein
MVFAETAEFDPVLHPFLMASNEAQAEASLSQLICQQKESTIQEIVRTKLRVSLSPNDTSHLNQEALDLVTDVQTAILSSLRDLKRNNTSSKPIGDFGGYVATVTFNACHQLLRRKYPKRFQLKNKLRYLLTHEAKFALWESDKEWVCGFARWRGSKRPLSAVTEKQRLREHQHRFRNVANANRQRQAFIDLISTTFEVLDGPVLLDELVSLMVDQLQIKEDVMVDDDERSKVTVAGHDSFAQLESQAQIRKLWEEICELPLRHRSALLLNLRDRRGTDALELFQIARVATIRDIAEVLDFKPEEFAHVWKELPWDDLKIANHLALTRQQVINLRQSARARLAWRVRNPG